MRIREARLEDASTIARVHIDVWRETYQGIIPDSYLVQLSYAKRTKQWEQALIDQRVYIVELEDEVVGFAQGGPNRRDAREGELYAIYVLRASQGQGLGKALFQRIIEDLAEYEAMQVSVLRDNPACQFYERFGGQVFEESMIERGGIELVQRVYRMPVKRSFV
ncbi:TPA_asm: GNAT family N-acetyltransferase [Salmonella enterica subsp. enterica serovar Enteritidis str. P125109]|uniref:GNAT family N-acetyltransferase n=1 Tax=Salmonella enteritidis PT4 (strain P125109) TaxID=550537 RepID=A0A724X1B3_SALEP|nr:GNAT family N-acetyltransferase [Salmonella enterica subsp. enterica serovar Enteritidis str. P125109]